MENVQEIYFDPIQKHLITSIVVCLRSLLVSGLRIDVQDWRRVSSPGNPSLRVPCLYSTSHRWKSPNALPGKEEFFTMKAKGLDSGCVSSQNRCWSRRGSRCCYHDPSDTGTLSEMSSGQMRRKFERKIDHMTSLSCQPLTPNFTIVVLMSETPTVLALSKFLVYPSLH